MSIRQQFQDFLTQRGSRSDASDESSLRSESYTFLMKKANEPDSKESDNNSNELRLHIERYVKDNDDSDQDSVDSRKSTSTLDGSIPLDKTPVPRLKQDHLDPDHLANSFSLDMDSVSSLDNSNKPTEPDQQHQDQIRTIMGGGVNYSTLALPSWVSNRSRKYPSHYTDQTGGAIRAGSNQQSYYCNSESEPLPVTDPQTGGFIRAGSNQQSYYCNSESEPLPVTDPQTGGFIRAGSNQQSYYCNSDKLPVTPTPFEYQSSDQAGGFIRDHSQQASYYCNSIDSERNFTNAEVRQGQTFNQEAGQNTPGLHPNSLATSVNTKQDDITSLSSVESINDEELIIDTLPPNLGKSC